MTSTLKPHEEWARQVIARTLQLRVEQHDDGSEESMYDLNVFDADGTLRAAIEVTTTTDGQPTAFWNAARLGEPWEDQRLTMCWIVRADPAEAHAKTWRRPLGDLLLSFEQTGMTDYSWEPEWQDPREANPAAATLGVTYALGVAGPPGRIFPQPPISPNSVFGEVSTDAVIAWAVDCITEPRRRDNLTKLRVQVPERHLFLVSPPFSEAPSNILEAFFHLAERPLPTGAPTLPEPLTGLWIMSGWTVPHGLRWSSTEGWSLFATGTS